MGKAVLLALLLVGLATGGYFMFFWEAAPEIPTATKVSDESLPEHDPAAFVKKCLEHYDRTVQGYGLLMFKQERIGGRLQKPEEVRVCFREQPFSVYMEWRRGARRAERALYVAGKNGGQMLARPIPVARLVYGNIVERDPEGPDGKKSGRYPITEFGLKISLQKILTAWDKARARNALHVEYLGIFEVEKLGKRPCYRFERDYDTPEDDGIGYMDLYIDQETLLLAATILKEGRGENAKLIGEYFFQDVRIDPPFKAGQFQRSALIPQK